MKKQHRPTPVREWSGAEGLWPWVREPDPIDGMRPESGRDADERARVDAAPGRSSDRAMS